MQLNYYVYVLTNKTHRVLYVGVTNNLIRRLSEHNNHASDGFSTKYNVTKLIYVEQTHDVSAALAREKQLKRWSRAKKNRLISQSNPEWQELKLC